MSDRHNFSFAPAIGGDGSCGGRPTMLKNELPIATFVCPTGLRDLCIGEQGTDASLDHPLDVQVFHIRLANSAGRLVWSASPTSGHRVTICHYPAISRNLSGSNSLTSAFLDNVSSTSTNLKTRYPTHQNHPRAQPWPRNSPPTNP